jgi:hypothetical protein
MLSASANVAFSDDYLFVSDLNRCVNVYAFAADGAMHAPVRTIDGMGQPRAMAVHRATDTLLIACRYDRAVRLLDIRPPPSDWKLGEGLSDRVPCDFPSSLAMDEANGFVFVSEFDACRIVQFALSVVPNPNSNPPAGQSATSTPPPPASTVRLRLTRMRSFHHERPLTSIAVLSADTLVMSRHGTPGLPQLSLKTVAAAVAGADGKSTDPIEVVLQPFNWHPHDVRSEAYGLWADADRRCLLVAELSTGRVTAFDPATGNLIAEDSEPSRRPYDVCVIDGVLLVNDYSAHRLSFFPIGSSRDDLFPGQAAGQGGSSSVK